MARGEWAGDDGGIMRRWWLVAAVVLAMGLPLEHSQAVGRLWLKPPRTLGTPGPGSGNGALWRSGHSVGFESSLARVSALQFCWVLGGQGGAHAGQDPLDQTT